MEISKTCESIWQLTCWQLNDQTCECGTERQEHGTVPSHCTERETYTYKCKDWHVLFSEIICSNPTQGVAVYIKWGYDEVKNSINLGSSWSCVLLGCNAV